MPKLELFNLESILESLNGCLSNSCGDISLGEFKKLKKSIFLRDKIIKLKGEFPLIQSVYGKSFIDGLMGCPSDVNIGKIFIEAGYERINVPVGIYYEKLNFKIKKGLFLKDSKLGLPSCDIYIIRKAREWEDIEEKRRDYLVKYLRFSMKTDLSKFLPVKF